MCFSRAVQSLDRNSFSELDSVRLSKCYLEHEMQFLTLLVYTCVLCGSPSACVALSELSFILQQV